MLVLSGIAGAAGVVSSFLQPTASTDAAANTKNK